MYLAETINGLESSAIRNGEKIKKNNDWSVNKVNNLSRSVNKVNNLKRDRINLGPPPSYSQSFNFYKANISLIFVNIVYFLSK